MGWDERLEAGNRSITWSRWEHGFFTLRRGLSYGPTSTSVSNSGVCYIGIAYRSMRRRWRWWWDPADHSTDKYPDRGTDVDALDGTFGELCMSHARFDDGLRSRSRLIRTSASRCAPRRCI